VALWILVASLVLIVYAYAGYPFVCALRARILHRPLKKFPDFRPKISVLIAAWREANNIGAKLESLGQQTFVPDEIILVCDGSDDGTSVIAREKFPHVQVIEKERAGKPAALNLALTKASGDVIVFTDARQPLSPRTIQSLVEDLGDEKVGGVGGALQLTGDAPAGFYWKYEALIRKWEARSGSTVGVSGALWAAKRALLEPMPDDTILDDVLQPMRIRLQGFRVGFEPDAIAYDRAAESKREFARKVRTLSGNFQLLVIEPKLLLPFVNPSWFDFVSHKLLRLVVPYAMVAALVSSFFLPSPINYALAGAQLGGYLLAVLSMIGLRFKIAALCETLVVLNAAAVVGLLRFIRYGRRLPWT
jgi:cellulose synthase/poly-beta-1,6-N-acetylglucosamine synthase-like glycosyltransferase